jgi:membrane-anchored protein YejM (alkaline phosphatase superfamily)
MGTVIGTQLQKVHPPNQCRIVNYLKGLRREKNSENPFFAFIDLNLFIDPF